MLDSMRKPIFVVALILILLTLMVELGSLAVLGMPNATASALGVSNTGKGIPAMALVDGLLVFATVIIGIGILVPERLQSKVQGIVTLVFSLVLLLACIGVCLVDLGLLFVMVGLLMAAPFGTIAYFAIWGNFDVGGAAAALSVLMTLKIAFAICLVLAQQRFLQNKGLVLLIVTSLVCNLIIAFLHGFVPRPLVSITDDVGGLVVGIIAAIWSVVYLIGGIISVIKVIV